MSTLRTGLLMLLGIALPLLVQLADKRRLSEEQARTAWNGASWASALYAFGPLSMLGWCWVTRASWRIGDGRGGLPRIARSLTVLSVGLLSAVVLFGLLAGIDTLLELAAPEP